MGQGFFSLKDKACSTLSEGPVSKQPLMYKYNDHLTFSPILITCKILTKMKYWMNYKMLKLNIKKNKKLNTYEKEEMRPFSVGLWQNVCWLRKGLCRGERLCMLTMCLRFRREDQNMQIDGSTQRYSKSQKMLLTNSWKNSWGIAETKEHKQVFKVTITSVESGFLLNPYTD